MNPCGQSEARGLRTTWKRILQPGAHDGRWVCARGPPPEFSSHHHRHPMPVSLASQHDQD